MSLQNISVGFPNRVTLYSHRPSVSPSAASLWHIIRVNAPLANLAYCGKTCNGAAHQETGEPGVVAYTLIPGLEDQGRTGLHMRQSQKERERREIEGRDEERTEGE